MNVPLCVGLGGGLCSLLDSLAMRGLGLDVRSGPRDLLSELPPFLILLGGGVGRSLETLGGVGGVVVGEMS